MTAHVGLVIYSAVGIFKLFVVSVKITGEGNARIFVFDMAVIIYKAYLEVLIKVGVVDSEGVPCDLYSGIRKVGVLPKPVGLHGGKWV